MAINALLLALLLGCGTTAKNNPGTVDHPVPPPAIATGAPLTAPAAQTATSSPVPSLWQQNSDFGTLFVSQKALRVGDIVTIKIVESSSAVNQATTTTGRDSSIGIKTEKFFGLENETADWNFNPLGELSASFESDFEGEGATKRSGDLTAYITANVTEVLPNGNLRILGNREVTINNEKQFIFLSGVIRTRDISPKNVILSTYIADAQIEYSGKGVVNDRQKPGWLTSLLNVVWPF
jgi:flagellar L-ring protein precursor FlgH